MKKIVGLGGEQIEGRHAVRELLLTNQRQVQRVLIAEGTHDSDIEELCAASRVRVRRVSRGQLAAEAMSEAPQGVIAYASPIEDVDLDSLFTFKNPFILALDGITDPHNIGALFRIGECAGVTGVVVPKNRSAHVTPTVAKASAGAVEHLSIALVPGLPSALSAASKAGVWVAGLDPGGTTSIYDLAVADSPIVLVLGAEGAGLSKLTKQRCDVLVDIPQYGTVASLNVSAAGAIACFEIARRRATA